MLVILILVILRLVINSQIGGDGSTVTEVRKTPLVLPRFLSVFSSTTQPRMQLVIRPPAPMNAQCIDLSFLLNHTAPHLAALWADTVSAQIGTFLSGGPKLGYVFDL